MGTTGSSADIAVNTALPDIINRVREYTNVPLAVGFGVATREQFNSVSDAGADGIVIGSRLVSIIKSAPKGQIPQHVEAYCREISHKGEAPRTRSAPVISKPTAPVTNSSKPDIVSNATSESTVLPDRFGEFGGQYVPESLIDCLAELEEAHKTAMADPEFWKEFQSYYGYMNRPSRLYFAENLTKHAGGAKIWLKREDLYVFLPIFR